MKKTKVLEESTTNSLNSSPRDDKSSKTCFIQRRRQRLYDITHEAACRTLNGNGSSPNLPPLPFTKTKKCRYNHNEKCDDNHDDDDDDDDDDGLATLFSHPYGALPYGNIWMSEGKQDQVRHRGLGPQFKYLNDEQILSILSFLDASSLSKVVQCSKFLYVAGHHDELWRDLTLRKFGSNGFEFHHRWRDTFVFMEMKQEKLNCQNISLSKQFNCHHVPHKPIKIDGIYSDTFFRSWLCRSFELQPSWLSFNNVPCHPSDTITLQTFLTTFEEKNYPLIIQNATKHWPALHKWDADYLIQQTQGLTFRATSSAAPLPAQFTMQSYTQYCNSITEEAPLYLFDRSFIDKCPHLEDDYVPALKKSLPFFDKDAKHGHDLFSLLGDGRPDYRWLIVGPKRSGSAFHIDPNCTHAWNAPIRGRKRWIFYPPGNNPPGVFPSPNGDDVIMPISLGEWFLTYWNDHMKQRNHPDPSKRPLECTVHPGDILFVPHGWWHCVLNLDDGLSIALTQNYVSKSNLSDVLRFLKTKPQQISGCRDRDDAIQPEELLDQFMNALNEKRPDLVYDALKISEEGWQCAAWTDIVESQPTLDDANRNEKVVKKQKTTSILDRAKLNLEQDGVDLYDNNENGNGGFSFSFLEQKQ